VSDGALLILYYVGIGLFFLAMLAVCIAVRLRRRRRKKQKHAGYQVLRESAGRVRGHHKDVRPGSEPASHP